MTIGKRTLMDASGHKQVVAPHVGAWIETRTTHRHSHSRCVAPHVGAFANVMFCVSVIMLLVWDVCLQNERWVSWVFYSRLGEVIAHLGWFVQEFHLFGVVFLPPNPLEEVFGRPFESRIVIRMTLPCAPMDMKIGVGEGDFRWR